MDRLTDRTLGPILAATADLDNAVDELRGWEEEAQEKLFPTSKPSQWAFSSEAVAEGLSGATRAVLTASDDLANALHQLRPQAL
jgi:hypothetical protein